MIRKKPSITRVMMARQLGLSGEGIKYHLDKLRKEGTLVHRGPTKKGYWEILKKG